MNNTELHQRIKELDDRNENMSLANKELRKKLLDALDENRKLKMAMREYEIAYEELGIPV